MDGRDAFLTMARERHYEFSSLRRAKFSSMSMLYELHNQGQDKFVYTCNNCKSHVETRYHCTVCDDFDLCISCKEKDGHPHHMEKLGLDLDDGSSPADAKQVNPQEARKHSIQRCIQSLVHAYQCRDANCRLPSCQKMKRVVTHTKVCKRKTNSGCPICKQLIALCCYHAKHCQEAKCLIPYCSNIKHRLKQQQLQQRLQQAQLLRCVYNYYYFLFIFFFLLFFLLRNKFLFYYCRRRMAAMNTRQPGVVPIQSSQPTSNAVIASGVAMKPGVSPTNLPSPHQSSMGMKPGTQTPPAHVLQVVKQVQEEAARQQAPHGYGKVAPTGGLGVNVGVAGQTGGVMPPPSQMQRPMPNQMPGNQAGTHLISMDQWQPRYFLIILLALYVK